MKIEDALAVKVDQRIKPLSGNLSPFILEGGQSYEAQVVLKINEIIDYINGAE